MLSAKFTIFSNVCRYMYLTAFGHAYDKFHICYSYLQYAKTWIIHLCTNAGLSWPLNYHFLYDVMALFTLALLLGSFAFPKSIEKRKEEVDNSDIGHEEKEPLMSDSN